MHQGADAQTTLKMPTPVPVPVRDAPLPGQGIRDSGPRTEEP
jgi:hypothetical protein